MFWKQFKKKTPPPPKKEYIPNSLYAFTIEGIDYYEYNNDFDYPLERMHLIRLAYQEFEIGLSQDNLTKFIDKLQDIITESGKAKGIKEVDRTLPKAFALIESMRYTMKECFNPDAIWKLIALKYFTIDEIDTPIDTNLLNTKIALFKTQGQDFFRERASAVHFPFAKLTTEQWEDWQNDSQAHLEAMNQMYQLGLTKDDTFSSNTQPMFTTS
jgi:hypothetical protein